MTMVIKRWKEFQVPVIGSFHDREQLVEAVDDFFSRAEKKDFVNIYFEDSLLWAHSFVIQDEFIERIRQKEQEESEWIEKYCLFTRLGRKQRELTEEDQEELERLIASLSDEDDDWRKTKFVGHVL